MAGARARHVAVYVLLLCLSACQSEPDRTLRIGFNAWPAHEFLYLAKELNFFNEAGVDVKLIEYASLADLRRGYERGKLNAMASTQVEVIQVKAYSNRDPRIVLALDYSNGGEVIIARNSINEISDLKGKRVGADSTSLPLYILARALENTTITLSDFQLINHENLALVQAYRRGEIDAIVTYLPYSLDLLRDNRSHVIYSSKEIPNQIVDVLSIEQDTIKFHVDCIQKIRQAWYKAVEFSKQHPAVAYHIMAKRENISPQEFEQALQSIEFISRNEQNKCLFNLSATIETTRNVLVDIDALPSRTPFICCIAQLGQSHP